MRKENILIDPTELACVASISVWFRGKETPRGKTEERDFSVSAAVRNAMRAKKCSPRSLTWPFFVQSLTLVLRSLLLNRTEMLAMQASTVQAFKDQILIF